MPIVLDGTTGITDADGGTVLSTADIASNAQAQAASDSTKVLVASNLSAVAIGVNQTWQVVTGSRAFSTTYTNSSGRPIQVCIAVSKGAADSSASATLTISGIALAQVALSASNGVSWQNLPNTLVGIIPAGATYSLAGTNAVISGWCELR